MKIVHHPKIGFCQVLIEAEISTKTQTKYYTLIRSKNSAYQYSAPAKRNTTHHYILWGNTPEFSKMGITQCLTDSLRACTGSSPMRKFFEIIQTADQIEFKQ